MPNDGFADVYLVIDNYRALAEENEVLIEQVNVIINQGPSFGCTWWSLPIANRSAAAGAKRFRFPDRVAPAVGRRQAGPVPVRQGRSGQAGTRHGRGQNYVRLDSDPQAGLHTLVARPALANTPKHLRVRQRGRGGQPARERPGPAGAPVAGQVRCGASARVDRPGHSSRCWRGRNRLGHLGIGLALGYRTSPESHLMVTGRRECGQTTTWPPSCPNRPALCSRATSAPKPPAGRPSAQVWLVDPRRQLLTTMGSDYLENFAYNLDGVTAMMNDLAEFLAGREPPPGLSAGGIIVALLVERSGDLRDRRRHPALRRASIRRCIRRLRG